MTLHHYDYGFPHYVLPLQQRKNRIYSLYNTFPSQDTIPNKEEKITVEYLPIANNILNFQAFYIYLCLQHN